MTALGTNQPGRLMCLLRGLCAFQPRLPLASPLSCYPASIRPFNPPFNEVDPCRFLTCTQVGTVTIVNFFLVKVRIYQKQTVFSVGAINCRFLEQVCRWNAHRRVPISKLFIRILGLLNSCRGVVRRYDQGEQAVSHSISVWRVF